MSDRADVVIVGAGLAGLTVARQLRRDGYDGSILVLGDEPHEPYDRPPLSKAILAGEALEHEVALLAPDEAERDAVAIRTSALATALDLDDRAVVLADGRAIGYQHCVIATGSHARRLPGLPDLQGLHYLRTLPDALALRAALAKARSLVVVGAGFIGLEVASVAVDLGVHVTVVERESMPLTRVLGPQAGAVVSEMHRARGVDVRCSVSVSEVLGTGQVSGVRLTDGSEVPADVVLLGAGAAPNQEWLQGSGLVVDDGVLCDANGRASAPGVWAAGDVARWPNAATGLHLRVEQWQSALEQAITVAHNIADPAANARWESVPYFWSDQCGTKIQFCGHPGERSVVLASPGGPVVGFGSDSRLTGLLTIGQPRLLARGRRLVARGAGWDELSELVAG